MFTAAANALLLALLMLLPTAPSPPEDDPKDGDRRVERIVVTSVDRDVEVDGDEPLVIQVGRRGFLGVSLVEITPELRAHYGAPRDAGVLVSGVEADTPAGKAGIQVGDVIASVDGESVAWTGDVARAVRSKRAGETVELEVVRDRATRKVTVAVEERKPRERTIQLDDLPRSLRRHGWVMRDLDKAQPILENLQDFSRLRERIEALEKRLEELEKKARGQS